jgi:hypothetical protein
MNDPDTGDPGKRSILIVEDDPDDEELGLYWLLLNEPHRERKSL